MSTTVDVNLLLYWSDDDNPFHREAAQVMESLTSGPELLYLFWPVLMSYVRLVTHARVSERPLPVTDALDNVAALIGPGHVRTPGEKDGFLDVLDSCLPGPLRGNDVPDAHLVALMKQHGVNTIVTNDRGFRRFDGIRVDDPFG